MQTETNTLKLDDGAASTSSTAPLKELIEFGRSTTDPDITYIKLNNASGTGVYISPAAGGTSLTISTTAP